MRNIIWYLSTAAGAAVLGFMGCTVEQTTPPAGATAASSGASSSKSVSVGVSGVSGVGGSAGVDCSMETLPAPPDCDACAHTNCCTEISDCAGDDVCSSCVGTLTGDCFTDAPFIALESCVTQDCPAECTPPNQCNPITNEGCGTTGDACDVGVFLGLPYFTCFVPPNDAVVCGACNDNNPNGPFCSGGSTCFENEATCSRYCCDDGDCGTGTCDMSQFQGLGVGTCITGSAASATPKSACDAPATSPSKGSCVTFTPVTGAGGGGGAQGVGGSGAGGSGGSKAGPGGGGEGGSGGSKLGTGGSSGKGGAGGTGSGGSKAGTGGKGGA
jgi:hypothetical protein